MPKLIIDNREVEVPSGATILDAAEKLGITIPTMCFLKGYEPSTSCMVCVVKIEGSDGFVPACGSIARDGMRVCSSSQEVRQARKTALELLLSDHLGDCIGPCQVACPARMNLPLMIRQIAAGDLRGAIATVKQDIALPAVLGRICPAPCEKACRRAQLDGAISICLLKRYVADVDLQSASPYLPPLRQGSGQACTPGKNKCVAIVGAGPAGLSAAYYLRQQGYDCTLFDQREKPGGALRYAVLPERLPTDVLDKEISLIERLGVKFQGQTHIGREGGILLSQLRRDFDAVFVAVGPLQPGDAECLGLETGPHGIVTDAGTYQTSLPGVFAGGDAVRTRRLTVRAVADGKEAAVSIGQYLSGQEVTGPIKAFNTHIGKLTDEEIKNFVTEAGAAPRVTPSQEGGGFTDEQARCESARCLHCECGKAESCKLRQYAQEYEARPTRYKNQKTEDAGQRTHDRAGSVSDRQTTDDRERTTDDGDPSSVLCYEPGKCIKCGLCIKIAAQAGERPGLTFVGRGFDVRVAVPFDGQLSESLKTAARQCAAACPTGALSFEAPRGTREPRNKLRG